MTTESITSQYETGKGCKTAEEDVYEHGCVVDSALCMDIDIIFDADSPEQIIEEMMEFFGVERGQIQVNACDEPGRVDIRLHESANSCSASENDYEEWKLGRKRLWFVTYTYHVWKVTRERVTFNQEKEDAS